MAKAAIAAALGIVSVSMLVAGYFSAALFGGVVTILVVRFYPEKREEVDPTKKAVFITGNHKRLIESICKNQDTRVIVK